MYLNYCFMFNYKLKLYNYINYKYSDYNKCVFSYQNQYYTCTYISYTRLSTSNAL